jgi:glycosyltransferase involved in cell wall biosynthesis
MSHHHGNKLLVDGRRWQAELDRLAGRRFQRVIAVSRWTREFLVERYGYPAQRVECIPNGWSGTPRPREPASDPTVVSVARLRAQKGHEVLLGAFSRVLQRLPQARLVLIGDGELRSAVEADIARRGIGARVTLTGSVDDVWPLLARAHVFALASHYEPLGISVLEAMAAGLPVVATAVGGVPELVRPGVNGELVAPGDEGGMADRLLELLLCEDRRRQLGEAGRRAAAPMTMDVTVRRHFELYERLVPGGRS